MCSTCCHVSRQLFAAVAEEELHRLAASGELPPDRLTRQLEAVRRLVQQRLKTKKEDSPTSAGDSVTAPDQKGPRRTTLYITNDFLLQPAPELEAAVLHELDSRCATSDTAWYHISVARERLTVRGVYPKSPEKCTVSTTSSVVSYAFYCVR